MRIVLTGPKGSGKSTIGKMAAEKLCIPFYDTDILIEEEFQKETGNSMTFREIFRNYGEPYFRQLELKALKNTKLQQKAVISTGGTTFLFKENQSLLIVNSVIVCLYAEKKYLWQRIIRNGIPAYLQNSLNPEEEYYRRVDTVMESLKPLDVHYLNTTGYDKPQSFKAVMGLLESLNIPD